MSSESKHSTPFVTRKGHGFDVQTDDKETKTPSEPVAVNATARQWLGRESRIWFASALLFAPVVLLYASHYLHGIREGIHPTGFVQYDMPYYMANAREHFDDGEFAIVYGNPFSAFSDTPKLYFQPMTLALALILRFFDSDPGTLFVVFGAISCLAAVRIAIALFEEFFGTDTKSKQLTLVCFIWAGGFIVATSAIWAMLRGEWIFERPFRFDPFGGWWFLNYGRNLCYPTEAFYHALSLGCIVLFCRKRFGTGIACLTMLSICHPFTGTQFLLILIVWLALERFFVQNRNVPLWVFASTLAIALAHFSYYLIFLPSYQEHATLMRQWSLDWCLAANNMLPAYGIVALMAGWQMRNWPLAARVLANSKNRLLIVWFLVSFLLANHEFAIAPRQPLHFTRGYIWTPLFLLGAPTLIAVFDRVTSLRHAGGLLTCSLLAVLLLDNAVWFTARYRGGQGVYIHHDEQLLLQYLGSRSENLLVICESERVGYLTTVYTKHRAWHSHRYNTPDRDERIEEVADFLRSNTTAQEESGHQEVVIVPSISSDRLSALRKLARNPLRPEPCYENSSFRVVSLQLGAHP